MPAELQGLLTPEHYEALMGFAGICAAFTVLLFFRG